MASTWSLAKIHLIKSVCSCQTLADPYRAVKVGLLAGLAFAAFFISLAVLQWLGMFALLLYSHGFFGVVDYLVQFRAFVVK